MAFLLLDFECQLAFSQSPNNDHRTKLIKSQSTFKVNTANIIEVAEVTRELDEKTARDLVWQLPEVQRKAREIERLSKGAIKVGAVVDVSPTPNEPYYTIRIFEDQPEYDSTIYWFRVSRTSRMIEVLDLIENQYISLEEWKEQLKR
ncbi:MULTISPECIES: hypothetical protein [unclassified Nostoc]|uniref:hypothetical protein n=1 Tax=unclassified Nostoc TaxID=2593658 RepID=UPI001F557B8E|nr:MULTISPECIES: hypothetical protein [unclassified Nostoc]